MGCGDAGGGSRLPPPFPATLVRGDSIGRGAGTRGAGKEEWATKRLETAQVGRSRNNRFLDLSTFPRSPGFYEAAAAMSISPGSQCNALGQGCRYTSSGRRYWKHTIYFICREYQYPDSGIVMNPVFAICENRKPPPPNPGERGIPVFL